MAATGRRAASELLKMYLFFTPVRFIPQVSSPHENVLSYVLMICVFCFNKRICLKINLLIFVIIFYSYLGQFWLMACFCSALDLRVVFKFVKCCKIHVLSPKHTQGYVRENVCGPQPKIFTIWLSTEKVFSLLLQRFF